VSEILLIATTTWPDVAASAIGAALFGFLFWMMFR
jgi:nitrate reductase NapE component